MKNLKQKFASNEWNMIEDKITTLGYWLHRYFDLPNTQIKTTGRNNVTVDFMKT